MLNRKLDFFCIFSADVADVVSVLMLLVTQMRLTFVKLNVYLLTYLGEEMWSFATV